MQHQSVQGRRVLVVGCNSGLDCMAFVDAGAKEVHGLDVDEGIGIDFRHPRVKYFRESAEAMPFKDKTYDLVFCFATMEHVPDIQAAFQEMARVTSLGGLLYCVASPLWNSRQGHHFPQYFAAFPWVHLRLDRAAVEYFLLEREIPINPANVDASTVASYMFDPGMFNRRFSWEYLEACNRLDDFEVLRNELDLEPEDDALREFLPEAESRGYTSAELRAVTHTFIGRKQRHGPFAKVVTLLKRDKMKSTSPVRARLGRFLRAHK